MVAAPGWPSSTPGVTVLPSGETVVGSYGATTVVKGQGSTLHTKFSTSDAASSTQNIVIGSRGYDSATTLVEAFDIYNSAAQNELNIGRKPSGGQGVTLGRLAAAATKAGSTTTVLAWNSYGVNVGQNPSLPTSGRAWQCTTTGQANALYVADADGTLHSQFSATSGSPNLAVGAGSELRFYNNGSDSAIEGHTDDIYIIAKTTGKDVVVRAQSSTGEVLIQNDFVNVAKFNSAGVEIGAGLVLKLVGQAGDPASPSAGFITFNATTSKFRGYDGSAWQDFH